MVITLQLGVEADLCVVSCTSEEVRVSAGQAAIARVTAGLSAVVRIPVVGVVVFQDDCFKVLAVSLVIWVSVFYFHRADSFIVDLHIFLFSACLVDGEYTV